MIEIQATSRVLILREAYMHAPMMRERTLGFWLCKRQRYLFVKGWKESKAENSLARRSDAYAYLLEHMRPVIQRGERIVGQPDYADLTGDEAAEWEELSRYECLMPRDDGRTDHMALDFEKLLRVGVNGLLAEVRERRDALDENVPADLEKWNFYTASERELLALLDLERRYAEAAETMVEAAAEPQRSELLEIASTLRTVPAEPARTFRQALQSIHFYSFCLWGLYQCGHPDRYLLPYYRRDIEAGILTPEDAQEWIDCFCLLYTVYINSTSSVGFMVGGRERDGSPVENELTERFLNSIPHTNTADPSIGFCVTEETGGDLFRYAMELLAMGYSHPAIYNDTLITNALMAYGVPEPDAHSYIHSCCVEITIDHKSDVWTVSPYHNTLQYLLDVLQEHEEAAELEELLDAYRAYTRKRIAALNRRENLWQLERSHNGGEPLLVSCLVDDCLRRGRGIYAGGAVYNWTQPNFLGIANTVESLLTVEALVFREKRLALRELNEILAENFTGHEALRAEILGGVTHFGVGNDHADTLYRRIAAMLAENCKDFGNYRGDLLMPAAFSYNEHMRYGRNTGASPDGRLAGEPLSDGSGPVQGRDSDGPTSMLRSITTWDHAPFLGGIAMNLKIQKSGDTERNARILGALIKTYLQRGGMEIQVNAVCADELRDAMQHPENHMDLIVRIGGYSDYYATLSRGMQEELLKRSENIL